uniref:Uncharacterized protein n=1 Tax=Setaria italica TaxID=4555 RepID=K4AKI7_SETIT
MYLLSYQWREGKGFKSVKGIRWSLKPVEDDCESYHTLEKKVGCKMY